VLNVVDFPMTGIGGDMFALVWKPEQGKVVALNGSGRSPYSATRDYYREQGHRRMPERGLLAVNVPGALAGWAELLDLYGTMPLGELLQPAIKLAEEGFILNDRMAECIDDAKGVLKKFPTTAAIFLRDGEPLKAGDLLVQKDLARTFRIIAEKGPDALYRGEIGERIARFCRENGGLLTMKDFEDHTSTWAAPIKANYRGYTVYEMPPNSQGIALLIQLSILDGWDLRPFGPQSVETITRQVEAKRVAFADRRKYVTDPEFADIPVEKLLSPEYAAKRRAAINLEQVAERVGPGTFRTSDTTTLMVVDKDRNCVSFINSLFSAMGSAVVAGDTGILLQSRANGFSLDEKSWNRLEPHKRTMHTLNPLMVFKGDRPYIVMGVIGGDQQTQGSQQIIVNVVDFGMNIQDALDAPRWRSLPGTVIGLEPAIGEEVRTGLEAKGYKITKQDVYFGGAQAIMIDPETGSLLGASDKRIGGIALGY
jgi:gamma-glutamyltranspeptidase/glutathione hydrolase